MIFLKFVLVLYFLFIGLILIFRIGKVVSQLLHLVNTLGWRLRNKCWLMRSKYRMYRIKRYLEKHIRECEIQIAQLEQR
jgi:hypothetical protein